MLRRKSIIELKRKTGKITRKERGQGLILKMADFFLELYNLSQEISDRSAPSNAIKEFK